MSEARKKSDLPDFQHVLLERGLVSEKHAPYYARWVIRYLSFVKKLAEEASRNEDLNVRAFLETLRLDNSIEDWQVRQADDAIKLYRVHYRGSADQAVSVNVVAADLADNSIVDKMRRAIRVKHYSYRTEKCYLDWVVRFAGYLSETEGRKLGACEASDIKDFLAYLALKQKVSSSTQNQAFNALLFLMRNVLSRDTADMSTTVRAKRGARLPVVLSVDEVRELLSFLKGKNLLIAQLLYGAGLRLMELARLRVQDIDFKMNSIVVRCGKGDKDRTTILPDAVRESLRLHMDNVKQLHEQDLAAGYGEVHLPDAVSRKYPNAAKSWGWQYLFPSSKLAVDPRSGTVRRHHMSDKMIQGSIRSAVKSAGIAKHATVHTLRHSFATHLIMNGINIREVQSLLGHKSLETTMIYTHVLRGMTNAPMSPLDALLSGGDDK